MDNKLVLCHGQVVLYNYNYSQTPFVCTVGHSGSSRGGTNMVLISKASWYQGVASIWI